MPAWLKWTIALLIGFGIIAVGFHFPWGGYILKPFFILNCLVLIIVVLLQSGKAADLAGAFGGAGSQTAFGPRGAASVLSQATTWCAIMFMVCAMAMVVRVDQNVEQGGSILEKYSKPAPKAATPAPVKPAPAAQTPAAPQSTTPQQQAPAPQPKK
jgi:preprotein translocase subunit SecG